MGIADVARTLAQVPTLLALKKGMQPQPLETKDGLGAMLERTAAEHGGRPAVIFEGREMSWGELNALANRYARVFKAQGLTRGQAASVLMENRIEFLATVLGLNKLGVTASLINTNLRGRPLIHCVTTTESNKLIFGAELTDAVAESKDELGLADGDDFLWVPDPTGNGADRPPGNWAQDLAALAGQAGDDNLADTAEVVLGDSAFYIFTSGTTGLPKAAVLSNRRYLASATLSHKAGLKCSPKDRLYICLPLYHGTGLMIGVGAAISSGASMFIRRKFSASNFLDEVRQHRTTCFIYIGELCRYLVNTPAKPDDHNNPLKRMMGNGMRPDVWPEFKQRFGIKRIAEFYGASEGNVAFANLLNKDCTVGMTSAVHALVRYDVDNDEIVRDEQGRCIEVEPGEPGLLLGQINPEAVFEGYTNQEATEKKIVRDAFEQGDAWFNSGDLMRQVDVGFTLGYPHYQFVDRVGDTFRWKSENVSTNEVGEIINGFDQVRFSNVYGVEVPGADGRAGMAALTLEDGVDQLDLDAFSEYVTGELPSYAVPIFLRVEPEIDVTGTFKMVKGKLREEGYDPDKVSDPLYVMQPGSNRYEPLDREFAQTILRGEAGY
ncbi:MAG: long-chain-acyl-CoA synthetase [Gammaproteobacteria bacterium]|jgi:citronellyl-CoA synthetase|nr:long-chain-acyl-CoA synthetase [Gammaproteobacteria bacterium]